MKMLYLILAHKNPKQLHRLVSKLNYKNVSFVIHIDFKSEIQDFKIILEPLKAKISFVTDRKSTNWGSFQIIEATITSLHYIRINFPDTDRVTLLSGQDYPIKPNKFIHSYFKQNKDKIFIEHHKVPFKRWFDGGINRFPYFLTINQMIDIYTGSQWWSFPMFLVDKILKDLNSYLDFTTYFKSVIVPDESFFQTLILNYQDTNIKDNLKNNNLRFTNWHPPYMHPTILREKYLNKIIKDRNLFARKFDIEIDSKILDEIDSNILNENNKSKYSKKRFTKHKTFSHIILVLSKGIKSDNAIEKIKENFKSINIFIVVYDLNLKQNNENNNSLIYKFNNSILSSLGFKPLIMNKFLGSEHFPLFAFFETHKKFDYYWVIEDDVLYDGNWKDFFRNFNPDSVKADFISSHINFYHQCPDWHGWKYLKNSQNDPIKYALSSFNQIFRISKEAIEYLSEQLKNGWIGHQEALLPTLLYNGGFTILDFGGYTAFCFSKKNKYYNYCYSNIKNKKSYTIIKLRSSLVK